VYTCAPLQQVTLKSKNYYAEKFKPFNNMLINNTIAVPFKK
jgi:hypothetical protein